MEILRICDKVGWSTILHDWNFFFRSYVDNNDNYAMVKSSDSQPFPSSKFRCNFFSKKKKKV